MKKRNIAIILALAMLTGCQSTTTTQTDSSSAEATTEAVIELQEDTTAEAAETASDTGVLPAAEISSEEAEAGETFLSSAAYDADMLADFKENNADADILVQKTYLDIDQDGTPELILKLYVDDDGFTTDELFMVYRYADGAFTLAFQAENVPNSSDDNLYYSEDIKAISYVTRGSDNHWNIYWDMTCTDQPLKSVGYQDDKGQIYVRNYYDCPGDFYSNGDDFIAANADYVIGSYEYTDDADQPDDTAAHEEALAAYAEHMNPGVQLAFE